MWGGWGWVEKGLREWGEQTQTTQYGDCQRDRVGEVEEDKRGMNGGRKRLDFGW